MRTRTRLLIQSRRQPSGRRAPALPSLYDLLDQVDRLRHQVAVAEAREGKPPHSPRK